MTPKRSLLSATSLCLAAITLGLSSCGGGGGGGNPPNIITVTLSPNAATVRVGDIQQFTATVTNTSNTAVTWKVNGITGGNSTVGTISAAGLYTAPASVPNPATVTVTAVLQANPTKSGSATVTITATPPSVNNALLKGQYAFSWFGSDNTSGVFVAGGTFAADGNGNITNGFEDGNFADGAFFSQPFTGTYSIGADGRGTATLKTIRSQVTFKFAVVSSALARFIEFDGTAAGKGIIEKQDPSAFPTALSGDYAFLLDGLDCAPGAPCAESMAAIGRFTADAGTLSQGIVDINHQSTVNLSQSFGGSYSMSGTGRETATFVTPNNGTWDIVFYVVSASKLLVVDMDVFPVLIGTAQRQTGGPFTNASLAGDYVFGLTTTSPVRPEPVILANVGWTHADGAGALSNGLFDENGGASQVLSGTSFQGTYSVEANGRMAGTIIAPLATTHWVFYFVSPSNLYMLEVDPSAPSDPNLVASGEIIQQQGGPFATSSLVGDFAFFTSGKSSSSTGVDNASGVFSADGAGGVLAITEDAYRANTLLADQNLAGTYSVGDSSRGIGSASIGPSTAHFYFVSPSKVLLIGMDSTELFLGIAEKRQ